MSGLIERIARRRRASASSRPGAPALATGETETAQSVAAQSVAAQSVAAQSVAAQSVAAQSVAAQSVATQSIAAHGAAGSTVNGTGGGNGNGQDATARALLNGHLVTHTVALRNGLESAGAHPSAGATLLDGAQAAEGEAAPETGVEPAGEIAAAAGEIAAAPGETEAAPGETAAGETAAPAGTQSPPAGEVASPPDPQSPARARLLERGRMRRRARYLRALRELQLRDLGGFLLEQHRFDRQRPELVQAKLASAALLDAELRALERALGEAHSLGEIRAPGIGGACELCGSVHGSTDRYCSSCGQPLSDGREAMPAEAEPEGDRATAETPAGETPDEPSSSAPQL